MTEGDDQHIDGFGPGRTWADPAVLSVGRLPMTALQPDRGSDSVLDLDGDWGFVLRSHPGGPVRHEGVVDVPGCWTVQDVGDGPQYTNIQMPFPGPPPSVPAENPTGTYHRRVEVPEAWTGRRIVLHVGGAETVLYVTVDGRPVGMGTDSRLAQEFDLTDRVRPGAGFDLALTVVRWGAATYLEDQDHWHHAGLHRSVLLYATPAVRIADLTVVADRDPATGDATLDVRVDVDGDLPDGASVEVLLDGSVVGSAPAVPAPTETFAAAYGHDGVTARVTAEVPDVGPWSAERPELHDVTVRLLAGDADPDAPPIDED